MTVMLLFPFCWIPHERMIVHKREGRKLTIHVAQKDCRSLLPGCSGWRPSGAPLAQPTKAKVYARDASKSTGQWGSRLRSVAEARARWVLTLDSELTGAAHPSDCRWSGPWPMTAPGPSAYRPCGGSGRRGVATARTGRGPRSNVLRWCRGRPRRRGSTRRGIPSPRRGRIVRTCSKDASAEGPMPPRLTELPSLATGPFDRAEPLVRSSNGQ